MNDRNVIEAESSDLDQYEDMDNNYVHPHKKVLQKFENEYDRVCASL